VGSNRPEKDEERGSGHQSPTMLVHVVFVAMTATA
jgi:hypothetical protein